MSKIGDLFVKLGLKKDEFSRGLKEAGAETQSFGGIVKGIASKGAIAFAAITTAVVGVISAIKDLARENQALGDAWARMTASMSASWDTLRTAVASMDFSNLISNMKEAGRLARELYDAADALGEIQTSYEISSARQAKRIAELKIVLRDVGKSAEERLEAGRELKRIYEDLEKNPTRGLERFSNASLDAMAGKLGFNLKDATEGQIAATRKEVENFFVWLGTEAGEAFNSAYAAAYKDPAKVYATTVAAQNFGLSDTYRTMLWNYQAKVGDDDRQAMEKAVADAYRQKAKAVEETSRIETTMNSILAQGTGGGGGGNRPKTIEEMQREFQEIAREAATEAAQVAAADAEVAAMAEQMAADIAETIPAYMSEYEREMADGLKAWIDNTNFMLERQAYINEQAEKLADEFTESVVSGYAEGIQTLTDQLFGLEDMNPGAVLQALLTPFADLAINEGKILMAAGLGIEAIKEALSSLNGPVAIAAGAALIAVGSAVKSGLAALAQAGGSAGYASTYNGASGSGTQTFATEMTIYVEGRISGRDIVLSGQKTVNQWNR